MNLPTLPTDNLYKFLALSGTIIFILSFYFPADYADKLNDKNEAINLKMATLEVDVDYKSKKVRKLKEIIDNTIKYKGGKQRLDANKMAIYYSQSEIKKIMDENDELSRTIETQISEIKEYSKNRHRVEGKLELNRIIVMVGSLVGSFMAFTGYGLWYYRIQRYQDIAASKEASK